MDRFDKIPYADLSLESTWTKLGQGSFGCVYKGEYLGTEVAIKEVLPSGDYDVDKYFQRECELLSQSRHPNIVQYLGLSLAPPTPKCARRILIISEYLSNGNLRNYIHDKSEPFTWRTRISFAIDLTRAVAYLHARNCLHRDLKAENALITELNRLKVCDFGFARIAAKNEEEMRRMSYCGTDGYMAPEILMGIEFGLPADVFSLGVIFCEISSRILVGGDTFKRQIPTFGIDSSEIRSSASLHCPKSFLDLTISCLSIEPSSRPPIREILNSLRAIEIEILAMEARGIGMTVVDGGGSWNVGTLSFSGTTKKGKKRPAAPRLPSFEGTIVVGSSILNNHGHTRMNYDSSQDSEDEVTAIAMTNVRVGRHGIGGDSEDDLLLRGSKIGSMGSDYSTEVIRRNDRPQERLSTMESTITIKDLGTARELGTHDRVASSASSLPTLPSSWFLKPSTSDEAVPTYSTQHTNDSLIISRVESNASYMTARTSALSTAGATIDHGSPSSSEDSIDDDVFHSTLKGLPSDILVDYFPAPSSPLASELVETVALPSLHRFSLIKPVFQKFLGSLAPYNTPSFIDYTMKANGNKKVANTSSSNSEGAFKGNSVEEGNTSTGGIFGGVKCAICEKRLGFMKAFLECDDCRYRCHIKCSNDVAPTCGNERTSSLSEVTPPQLQRPAPAMPSTSSHSSKLLKKQGNQIS